jgi:DNA-binding HxlR family transcriptional regulator
MDARLVGGLLAILAKLQKDNNGQTQFSTLREFSGLRPEVLVEAVDELISDRLITAQRSPAGNPYGLLALTPLGQWWVLEHGAGALDAWEQCSAPFRMSSPERSHRRRAMRADGQSPAQL